MNETPPCDLGGPAESPASCNTLPRGYVDHASASQVTGYAFDADVFGEIDVHLYRTPPGGTPQFLGAVRTTPRPDEGPPGTVNFRFAHALPPGTTVEVFAINVGPDGLPAGVNPSLGAVVIP